MVIHNSNKNAAKTPEDPIFREAMDDLFRGRGKIFNKDKAASPRAVKNCVDNLKLRFPRR